MKIYDISMEIEEGMVVYKNKDFKKPKIEITSTIEKGHNETKLHLDAHTGTHADAYYHMVAEGQTLEKIPVDKFVGSSTVIDFSNNKNKKITGNDLKDKRIRKDDIIILKTKNKPLNKYDFNFIYPDKSAAEYLVNKRIKCLGVDNLSVERDQPNHDTHKVLLKNKIPIIEGLELSKIKPGRYFFIGLPLKIKHGDGSPIRAVLLEK
jgi:arylformamidase